MTATAHEIRAENYAAKLEHEFACGECGKGFSILVVTERTTGELTTRCEHCLDRRTHEVRPHQWDSAEKLRALIKKEKGWT